MKNSEMMNLKGWRHPTPQELKGYRKAIEAKLGVKLPPRGRPPKKAHQRYCAISIRLHPVILKWAKKEARKKHTRYQTVINETLLKHAA